MENNASKLHTPLPLTPAAADALIAAGDGDCALLYLYRLRRGVDVPLGEAGEALGMSAARVRSAAERLRALGLSAAGAPLPPDELPQYTAEEVVRRSESDPAFTGVLTETEAILGRTLSGADMKTLFGVYDHLGLPPEVILLLLHHCVEDYREKYGPGRVPPMRWVEKEAYAWANRELMTLDAAEDYLRELRRRRDASERLKRALGIRDRELTPSERKYLESWLDLGFPPEALELAYDRTVIGTGSLKWAYMNKIVLSWDAKGLHSVDEIEKGDGPRRPSRSGPGGVGDDAERMRRAYEKLKNGSR